MVIEQEEGENRVNSETKMNDRVRRMDCMFERREMTPLKEDGSGEYFQEDPGRGKENQKTPSEVKQRSKDSKGSNPDGKKVFTLTKKEMRAEVQRMIAEVSDITGCTMIRRKPYQEWVEHESYT